jgi:hypothetical protein
MNFRPVSIGVLLVFISAIAYGKDDPCPNKMLVEVTGTVHSTNANKAGGITVHLTNGRAKCLDAVWFVEVDKPLKPSCKPGATLVAKVPLEDTITMLLWGPAVSYSCR